MHGLGERIKTRRQQLSLSQEQLGQILGVSAQAVSKWEREENDPDIIHLPKLAERFSVSTDWLLGVGEGALASEPACIAVFGVSGARLRSVELSPAAFGAWCSQVASRTSELVSRAGGDPVHAHGAAVLACFTGADAEQRCSTAIQTATVALEVPLKLGVCSGDVWRHPPGSPLPQGRDVFGEPVSFALALADWVSTQSGHAAAWANPSSRDVLPFAKHVRGLTLRELPPLEVVSVARWSNSG